MPFDIEKKDIRVFKTKKSINSAMFALLMQHNFRKITIKDICEEALISRATFYSHFIDKYDLLKYWMNGIIADYPGEGEAYEHLEKEINHFVRNNKQIIKNVLEDADCETLDILFDFIISMLNSLSKSANNKEDQKHIVVSNIFAGGIVYYLLWHVKNRFPFDVMNIYMREIIESFMAWHR